MMLKLCVFLSLALGVFSHGTLNEPPSRGSMWRHGFPNPQNWNDMGQNCGGTGQQWPKSLADDDRIGLCGICGDPYSEEQPRRHEAGGLFGNGIIVREYTAGQEIDIVINITAQHKGYLEMRLCPWNQPDVVVTRECLDQYVLEVVGLNGGTRYSPVEIKKVYNFKVKLPEGVTCEQCVIQWKYYAGNSWNFWPGEPACTGCGPQETFWACADVRIV